MTAIISLYISEPRHACGERTLVVVREGRKHAHLLDPYTLESLTLPAPTLKKARPSDVTPRQAAKRIRAKRRDWRRYGFKIPGRLIKEALAGLEATP